MAMSEEEIYRLYFSPGCRFEQWVIVSEIGSGALGKVFLARSGCTPTDGSYGVLKVFLGRRISPPLFEAFLRQEYKILTNLDGHVNIVKPLPQERYTVWKGECEIHYLALEYCPGGNLEKFRLGYERGVMPPADVFLCLQQIVQGLEYAHAKEVIHGDICAENVLLMKPGNLKIADFGLSRISAHNAALLGRRLPYQAPEALISGQISKQTDMWALGVLLYLLLTGSYPFAGRDDNELYQNICGQTPAWPDCLQNLEESAAASLVYFVGRMLSVDPDERPSSRDISLAIQRCHYLVQPDDAMRFGELFRQHVERVDLRAQVTMENVEIPPQESREGSGEFWQQAGAMPVHSRRHSFWSVATLLSFLALAAALYWTKQSWWPAVQAPWQETWQATLDIGATESPYVVNITCRYQRNGRPLGWQEIRQRKLEPRFHYRHQAGLADSLALGEAQVKAEFPWSIPGDCPDGKLSLWLELGGDNLELRSPVVELHIQGLQEDRQMFKAAEQQEQRYGDDVRHYESVAQEFARYLQQYPHGFYAGEARHKLEQYRDKLRQHLQQQLLSLVDQFPEKIGDIVEKCEQFIGKYPEPRHHAEVATLRNAYRQLLEPVEYQVTLVKASFANRLDRADCYVQVFVNDKQVFVSPVSKNNNQPSWNIPFKMTWKAGDTIAVKVFDKNLWKDTCYFQMQDSGPFSLGMLCKRLQSKQNWVEFQLQFPFASYQALARKFGR